MLSMIWFLREDRHPLSRKTGSGLDSQRKCIMMHLILYWGCCWPKPLKGQLPKQLRWCDCDGCDAMWNSPTWTTFHGDSVDQQFRTTIWHQQLDSSPIRSCVTSGQGLATIATDTIFQILRRDPSNSCACGSLMFIVFLEFKHGRKKLKVVWSCHFSRPSHWTESTQTPSTCQFLIKGCDVKSAKKCIVGSLLRCFNSSHDCILAASPNKQVRDSWWHQPSLPHRNCSFQLSILQVYSLFYA